MKNVNVKAAKDPVVNREGALPNVNGLLAVFLPGVFNKRMLVPRLEENLASLREEVKQFEESTDRLRSKVEQVELGFKKRAEEQKKHSEELLKDFEAFLDACDDSESKKPSP
jgi:hypothetical protein